MTPLHHSKTTKPITIAKGTEDDIDPFGVRYL